MFKTETVEASSLRSAAQELAVKLEEIRNRSEYEDPIFSVLKSVYMESFQEIPEAPPVRYPVFTYTVIYKE